MRVCDRWKSISPLCWKDSIDIYDLLRSAQVTKVTVLGWRALAGLSGQMHNGAAAALRHLIGMRGELRLCQAASETADGVCRQFSPLDKKRREKKIPK